MSIEIPAVEETCEVRVGNKKVTLTNLRKIFWPKLGKTKRDLLLYYAAVAPVLLPHLKHRAMTMKRRPNGIDGKVFFMKRTPVYRPDWLETCPITHSSGRVIDFPMVQDLASLLWAINLGCIDLNPWCARCDDVNRPDFLHFDLDPAPSASFDDVRRVALLVKAFLDERKVESYAKTSGSRGIHIYVPIQRKSLQKDVWKVAKRVAIGLAKQHPNLITAEYRLAQRPAGRVLVDYRQNAWGQTLASVYSLRARREAPVSAPVSWREVERGISIADFSIDSMPERIAAVGDLFQPVLRQRSRCHVEVLM